MPGAKVVPAPLMILALSMDRPRATQIAARAGQTIAFLFVFMGLTSGNLLLLLIAVFIFLAATAESSDVMMRAQTHDVPASDAMIARFRERAAAVKQRPLPPVAGEERQQFIAQAKIDYQDFAILGDATASIDDGILTFRIDLRPEDQRD